MNELLYFDCHAVYGARPQKHREARWSLDHLLQDMELAGIAGALVTHAQALHYDPMLGNLRLIKEIGPHRDRLLPCWVVLPTASGEFPEPDELLQQMRQHDVRAVRIEPGLFGIPVNERVWRKLRDALAAEHVPVLTSLNLFEQNFAAVEGLLEIFAELPVILLNHGWHQWRQVVYLMETFPNLHIEFSAFQAHYAVEHFAERFGPQRCMFGTSLMEKAPGAARGFLDWSLLPREQTALIAGGNLKRLLNGSGPSTIPSPGSWHDVITTSAREGRPLPCEVIDAHCHILHTGGQTAGSTYLMLDGDADGLLRLRRLMGIDRTAIMSWVGPLCMDADLGNRIVEKAISRHPDHFIGVATVNPEYQTEAEIQAIIDHYHIDLGFSGLKTYTPRQTLRYIDPLLSSWFRHADQHRLYAVIDTAGEMNDGEMLELARTYPNMSIHLDHCGRSWTYAKWAVRMMRECANIWAQLNFTAVTNGVIEYLVEQIGADRLLFGTDSPMRDPRPQGGWLTFTRLCETDKRSIFGGNFHRLLDSVC